MSGGKSVSSSQHPQALEFVSYKLAEKFVVSPEFVLGVMQQQMTN